MKRAIYLLSLLALAAQSHAMELFVGPDGDDANPGTKARPLASLEVARDRLRTEGGGEHTIARREMAHLRA
jgi:hypothetical protein